MSKRFIDELRIACVVGLDRLTLFWKNLIGSRGVEMGLEGV